MLVADLRHFLNMPDWAPGPARRLADELITIVRAATAGDAGAAWISALECRRRPGHRTCTGSISIVRTEVPALIRWWCTSCADAGTINGWERTPFDLRLQHGELDPVTRDTLVVSAEVAATLRSVLVLDPAVERAVFRARTTKRGVELFADERELDDLLDAIAAEANHETKRPRRVRLDDALAALEAELLR